MEGLSIKFPPKAAIAAIQNNIGPEQFCLFSRDAMPGVIFLFFVFPYTSDINHVNFQTVNSKRDSSGFSALH